MEISQRLPFDERKLMLMHGLLSSSQSSKAVLLRAMFPEMIVPDFIGTLEERMAKLYPILGDEVGWTLVGSSFGGLMAALFTVQRPLQVRKLILLAPALNMPEFAAAASGSVDVPTIIYHGIKDDVVPPEPVRAIAEKVFSRLTYHAVDDDHRLKQAVLEIDWLEQITSSGME